MSTFRLAIIQMLVEGGRKQYNLSRATRLLEQAARGGAVVAVLPEALDLGWTDPGCLAGAGVIPDGETCVVLRQAAKEHRLYVCAGVTERWHDQVFNAAVLIDPNGEVILHHRKLNELEIGHRFYAQGDRLGVAATPLGTFGLMICADAFAPGQVITRTLGMMGAQVILSPSAWAVPSDYDHAREPYGRLWLDNYGPVARDFQMWIAGASNVGWITGGPWEGRRCIGCSLLVGPDGAPVLQGPFGHEAEMILYADITPVPRPARGDGWVAHWSSSG